MRHVRLYVNDIHETFRGPLGRLRQRDNFLIPLGSALHLCTLSGVYFALCLSPNPCVFWYPRGRALRAPLLSWTAPTTNSLHASSFISTSPLWTSHSSTSRPLQSLVARGLSLLCRPLTLLYINSQCMFPNLPLATRTAGRPPACSSPFLQGNDSYRRTPDEPEGPHCCFAAA